MKNKILFTTLLLSANIAFTSPNVDSYIQELTQWGSKVSTSSEGQTDVAVKKLEHENIFKDSSQNCENGEKFQIIVQDNSTLAMEVFLNEVVSGDHNKAPKNNLKLLLKEMKDLQLYTVGCRSDESDFEVSTWNLVGSYQRVKIVLSHERVYT